MSFLLALNLHFLDGTGKIIVFLIMLSILVVLHEAGHFLLARLNNVKVNDFAVGFGPTLFKWTSPKSNTNYRINLLPIGGYCAMQGEDEFDKKSKADDSSQEIEEKLLSEITPEKIFPGDSFSAKKPWQRLSIIVAGPIANFILAFAIFFIGVEIFGTPSDNVTPKVGMIISGSPADKSGLQLGDEFISIDGIPSKTGRDFVEKIHKSANVPLHIIYKTHGELKAVTITPYSYKIGKIFVGRIGITPLPGYEHVGLIEAMQVASQDFGDAFNMQVSGYKVLFSHPVENAGQMSGVIGMARIASMEQDLGWGQYLRFAAIISVALGLLNLLPFPALDGGRGLFIIIEMLRGKPIPAGKEAVVHFAGFALLMVLMVAVAYHDIVNLISGKHLI